MGDEMVKRERDLWCPVVVEKDYKTGSAESEVETNPEVTHLLHATPQLQRAPNDSTAETSFGSKLTTDDRLSSTKSTLNYSTGSDCCDCLFNSRPQPKKQPIRKEETTEESSQSEPSYFRTATLLAELKKVNEDQKVRDRAKQAPEVSLPSLSSNVSPETTMRSSILLRESKPPSSLGSIFSVDSKK